MSEGEPGRRVIDGRFELQARLGGGGMGMVWRARDVVLDRAVALKEVRPPDPGLAEYDPPAAALLRARVLREARALARVDHPNVVTIHHVVDGGEHVYPWLVMELVTGGSLADRLARGPMEPREAALLGREVFAALRAAHAVGIQHRDVKPANVLLRPDGRPVLTDFGIAAIRESTALTATGSIIGTPDYMAPERIAGGDGGPEADLWSLAMMLYVAVEGDHPLRRGSTLATLAAVLNEELPPPRRAGVLAPALVAMLAKDPAARPLPDAVDAMLAEAAAGRTPAPHAAGDGDTTSFHLAPPVRPADPQSGPQSGPAGQRTGGHPAATGWPTGPAAPFGGPHSVRDAVPGGDLHDRALRITAAGDGRDARAERTRRRVTRIVVAASLASTVIAGVLLWRFLPGDDPGGGTGAKPGPTATGSRTPSASPAADPPGGSGGSGGGGEQGDATVNLLTPEGIRTAVAALKKATGTDRLCSLSVYPEYVSAEVMLDGSNSRHDSWTYRPGKGAEKGIISGSVTPMESAFDVDDFDWDAVPALFERADKELNVPDVSLRYLLVEGADPTFGDPKGMSAYLTNDHSQSGYISADHKGKVLKVMPNDED
ncbi:serine/threonine-protein kinase [Streptomyces sp. t39]|uniref:serine/threonine-protein kinase n=1 Tax=Streptomyces sp. t39 TaxID=1828156 RepID=UPI0011CE6550|nr:serine/threonine-protein kinase [Streptomyces sp. t39]TXS52697.1 serine/threonine protein kinase [Streptomyces sp. t39]